MGIRSLEKSLESLDAKVGALRAGLSAIERWRGDAAAALFHHYVLRDGVLRRMLHWSR